MKLLSQIGSCPQYFFMSRLAMLIDFEDLIKFGILFQSLVAFPTKVYYVMQREGRGLPWHFATVK